MTKYYVQMRDEHGSDNQCEIEADTRDEALAIAAGEVEEWCRDGEWGADGASVDCWYSVSEFGPGALDEVDRMIDAITTIDCAGDGLSIAEVEDGTGDRKLLASEYIDAADALRCLRNAILGADAEEFVCVEIEPDHATLIRATTGEGCGDDHDDHDWTSAGEGGLDENPGVWSIGGTRMKYTSHCRRCGLHRTMISVGSQRNPGEHDTVEYEMLDDETIEQHRADGTMDAE